MADKHIGHHKTAAPQLPEFPNAACRGMSVELFITDAEQIGRPPSAEPAKRVCWRCPEKEPCLEYALANPSLVGVWGGTTSRDRQAIRVDRAMS